MHILIITQYFWPEEFRINDLVDGLLSRGHQVTVLTGIPSYPSRKKFTGYSAFSFGRDKYQDIPIIRVPMFSRGNGRNRWLVLNYVSFMLSASLLAPFLCRKRYDAIFVFQPSPLTSALPAIVLRALKRIPVFLWVQDLWPETLQAMGLVRSPKWLARINKAVRFIYRRCDQILVQAPSAKAAIESHGIDPSRIRYLPNWSETFYRPISRDNALDEAKELPKGFTILFAGNLGVAQSWETILGAAEQLRSHTDIHWVILGDGRQTTWIKEQVSERGLHENVHLLGKRPVETMPHYFALADALLISLQDKLIFRLTIPSKLQSYLACGRPIIAALDGDSAQAVLDAGAGLVGPPQDAEALANNVLSLYHMPADTRQAMGEKGRAYYERSYHRERLIDSLEGWMQAAIVERPCES